MTVRTNQKSDVRSQMSEVRCQILCSLSSVLILGYHQRQTALLFGT
jgi:hypothetical protein